MIKSLDLGQRFFPVLLSNFAERFKTYIMNWTLDKLHSEVGFKVKHMMITNVTGNFGDFDAQAKADENNFMGGNFEFSALIDSISTGVADRDAHLKSDDFFNAETYPTLTFKSNGVTKTGEETFTLTGEMTIRDITKTVELSVEHSGTVVDPYGQLKAGMSISGRIKRSDFGLKWNAITEAGSIVVSDEIKLSAELQFIKS